MRGDDQASRYPPRGVWFGLILLCGIGPVLFAQDEPNGTAARRVQDPIVLAGHRVTAWSTADGRWVHLFDRAAVLQGVEGLRAKEAIVRIVEQSSLDERTFEVEVYAEGDVSVVGASGSVSSRHTILHTAKEPPALPLSFIGFHQPEAAASTAADSAPLWLLGAEAQRVGGSVRVRADRNKCTRAGAQRGSG